MKKAAGVSDVDEVVRRFETQEETTKHLSELQVNLGRFIRISGNLLIKYFFMRNTVTFKHEIL